MSAPMIKWKKRRIKNVGFWQRGGIHDRLFSEPKQWSGKEVGMEGEKWMEIRNDRLKGMSYTELGRKYHIDPRTAKRYAESPQSPEYTLSVPKPTKLDAYKQQVDQWLEEAPYSAVRILEKLKEQGFEGKYSIVKEYVRSRKMDLDEKATVRFETMPGKQGQMDWGFFEEHTVYEDGKWKKL